MSSVRIASRKVEADVVVTGEYNELINGYAATLKGSALEHVLASKDVDYVEQDGVVSIKFE